MSIIVVGERSPYTNGVLRRGRYEDPAVYWSMTPQRGNFNESQLRRVRRLVPKGEIQCMYLLMPHPIRNYWRLNEARLAAKAFVSGCETPANVLCAGMRVTLAFKLYMGALPRELGEPIKGVQEGEGITFYRIPNLRDVNPQWTMQDLIKDCRSRLHDHLGA